MREHVHCVHVRLRCWCGGLTFVRRMARVACKKQLLLTSSNEVEWTIYGACTWVWNSVSEPVGSNGRLNALSPQLTSSSLH